MKFENPRRGRQERNFSVNDPKILELKSSSGQIIFLKLSLGTPDQIGLLFTRKNYGDVGAISVPAGICSALISKVELHISDGFCATLWCSVNRYSDRSGSELEGARTGIH